MIRNFFTISKSPSVPETKTAAMTTDNKVLDNSQHQPVHFTGPVLAEATASTAKDLDSSMMEPSTFEQEPGNDELFAQFVNDGFELFVHANDVQPDPPGEVDHINNTQTMLAASGEQSVPERDQVHKNITYPADDSHVDSHFDSHVNSALFVVADDFVKSDAEDDAKSEAMDVSVESIGQDTVMNEVEESASVSGQKTLDIDVEDHHTHSSSRTASPGLRPYDATAVLDHVSSADPEQDNISSSHDIRGRSRSRVNSAASSIRARSVPSRRNSFDKAAMASWPPQHSTTAQVKHSKDVFPGKHDPLHVWIQAYALRWAVWAMEVQNPERRQQLLDNVTDKMSKAWEIAIKQGYYARPAGSSDAGDHINPANSAQDGTGKRGRKRALSPSRCPAGFEAEGNDKLAVTIGELAKFGLTMDQIKQRVVNNAFSEGKDRLADVMSALPGGRQKITPRDWSATMSPSVPGRNLQMYSFFVVQEARTQIRFFERCMDSRKTAKQVKILQQRIDIFRERELQHLALATELTLLESKPIQSDESEAYESDDVDSRGAHDDELSDGEAIETASESAKTIPDDTIYALAREVLETTSEQMVSEVFKSRTILGRDLTHSLQGASGNVKTILESLVAMLETAGLLLNINAAVKTCSEPAEKLRRGHGSNLLSHKLDRLRVKLGTVLAGTSETEHEPSEDSTFDVAMDQPHAAKVQSTVAGESAQSLTSDDMHPLPDEKTSSHQDSSPSGLVGLNKAPVYVDSTQPDAPAECPSFGPGQAVPQLASSADASSTPGQTFSSNTEIPTNSLHALQAKLKQEYLDSQWVPWLSKLLHDRQQPALQSRLIGWHDVRSVLESLGYGAEIKNQCLKKFKAGFLGFCQTKGLHGLSNIASSQASPVASPTMSPSFKQMGPSWPTDAEIIAAIPFIGIAGGKLMSHFGPRIKNSERQFVQHLSKLASIDQQFYVRQKASQSARWSGGYPTTPSSTVDRANPQLSGALPSTTQFNGHRTVSADHTQSRYQLLEEVNQSRGFAFRHLKYTTNQERDRMEEHIGDYITRTLKGRKKDFYGTYVSFTDPESPQSKVLTVGVWLLKSAEAPSGFDWFYRGEQGPVNFDILTGLEVVKSNTSDEAQSGPRLRLNVSRPMMVQNNRLSGQQRPNQGPVGPNAVPSFPNNSHTGYTGFTPQTLGHFGQSGFHGVGTINPQLLRNNAPYAQSQHTNVRAGSTRGSGGVKRSAVQEHLGNRKKKVKTQKVEDDLDDSGDYDPAGDW